MNAAPEPLQSKHLIAHRGQLHDYPENSLAAFTAAVAAGAVALEVDVQLSADHHPVLYHDADMQRISGQAGTVYQLPLADLLQIPAHEPARLGSRFRESGIASLRELTAFLSRHSQLHCYVEMKPQSIKQFGAQRCWQALSTALAPVLQQCTVISFDVGFLMEVKAAARCQTGIIIEDWQQALGRNKRFDVVFSSTDLLGPDLDLRQCQMPLAVYEVASPSAARQWLQRGVSLVETHDIAKMLGKH